MRDMRSEKCVFLSHCLLAQTVRAEGVAKWKAACKPVIQFCLDNDINMIQLPCPEVSCSAGGLGRSTHGKKYYEENSLRGKSTELAKGVVQDMHKLIESGKEIIGIITVHMSPACSPNEGRSPYNPKGIFIEELQKQMQNEKVEAPFIGVSDRWLKKLDRELNDLIVTIEEF